MSTDRTMCPHCGYNFAKDEPMTFGEWRLYPSTTFLGDRDCGLTPPQAGILYSLAKANGEWVSIEALLNRHSDSETPNVISVQICRIREKLGEHSPIRSRHGRQGGYRWGEAA